MARSKLLPLCATTVAAVSCKSGTGLPPHLVPQLFNDVRPNGLVAAAEAIASVEPAGESAITVTVQFQNDSALPVELRLLGGNCLIRFIAYADPNLRGVWSWNGILEEPVCNDLLRVVIIAATGSTSISQSFRVTPRIRERLPNGPVYLLAVVQRVDGSRPLGIDAGRLQGWQ